MPPRVTIRATGKHITLGFPRARLLGVDVTELRTYDERRGLWNTFQPADRDEVFQLARTQLGAAAGDLAVIIAGIDILTAVVQTRSKDRPSS